MTNTADRPDPADRILALIPAYEEGPRIAMVIEAARRHMPVLVVDDGSSDDTAERAEAAGATVLRQLPNAGKGAALRTGFRQVLNEGAAAVITLDADGQHDPAEIPAFLEAFERARPELVIGQRDFGEMPPVRRLSNVLGGLTLSAGLTLLASAPCSTRVRTVANAPCLAAKWRAVSPPCRPISSL